MSKVKGNWTVKLFALLIAIFLWSYVMSEVNPVRTTSYKDVNVTLTNISSLDRQGLVVMSPKSPTINVTISGNKTDMDRFTPANIIAEIDLEGHTEGEIKIPVNVKLQNTSSNIKLENFEPKEILFKIDKIISKEVNVNVQTLGELPEGYILEEVNKNIQNIVIKGPRTLVNEVSEARAIVDLTDKTNSSTSSLPVQLLNDEEQEVGGIEKDPGIVDVELNISKTMSLDIELETINELPENININDIKIYPTNVQVKGSGDFSKFKKIKTKAVDINSLIGKSSIEVELALPDGLKLIDPKQKVSISYSVEEIVEKEFTFLSNEINIINLDEKFEVEKESLPSKVKVVLKGSKAIFDNISKDNVKLYIDLEELSLGTNEIDLKVEEIKGLTLKTIDPAKSNIKLKEKEIKEETENEENIEESIEENIEEN